MKNREYRTLIALALTLTLTASASGISPVAVYAKESAAKTQNTSDSNISKTSYQASSDAKPYKDETVYAKINSTGSVTSITVSDQLKNITDKNTIEDVSSLKDIENVKGDETFSQNNQKLTWTGNNKNICYQGTTTQTLPVGINVTYTLNGKTVNPEDLEGKSGHLVIHYQYENNTKSTVEKYTPFLMVTGLVLDSNIFTNATTSNGKLVSDGDRDIAIGMGLPGLKANLGVSDLDIPDYFEVEADVADYQPAEDITIATNQIFNDLDTDQFDSLSDLLDSMNSLQSAADQLVDGSGELKTGLDTLLSSSGALINGIGQLAEGGITLKSGTQTLVSGSSKLALGSQTLSDGTSKLSSGTGTLKNGVSDLNINLARASAIASGDLKTGVITLSDSVDAMKPELTSTLTQLAGGIQQLNNGLNTVQDGQQSSLKDGAAALSSVLNNGTPQTGGKNMSVLAQETLEAAYALQGQIGNSSITTSASDAVTDDGITDSAIATLNDVAAGLDESDPTAAATIRSAMDSLNSGQEIRNAKASELDSQIQAQSDTISNASNMTVNNLTTIITDASMLKGMADSLAPNASAVNAGVTQAADGAAKINTMITDKDKGLPQVSHKLDELQQGTTALKEGIAGENGLANGLVQLSAGASKLNSGAASLDENMQAADAGAKSVTAGASQLSSGVLALDSGAGALSNGIQDFQAGSAALVDGVKKLDDGAATLNDGMIQFNEKGIQKLVSVFNGDIDSLLDKLNTMLDASRKYKNFSGISNNMDGEVKFVFVSDK